MLVRFNNGAKGAFSVGQVCAGHKNDLVLEVCGAKTSLVWKQEAPERAVDWPPRRRQRAAPEGSVAARRRGAAVCAPAGRASGGVGRCVRQPDARHLRIHRGRKSPKDAHPPSFATFEDGYRANCVVESILKSAKAGAWTPRRVSGRSSWIEPRLFDRVVVVVLAKLRRCCTGTTFAQ